MAFFLSRRGAPPDVDAFGANKNAPDAQNSWNHFGGQSLQAAYDRFCSMPESYQEDFMWMGPEAFAWYFPVIDRYMREIHFENERDDCSAAIIGSAVASQFHWKEGSIPNSMIQEIRDLADFVLANLTQYSAAPSEQLRVEKRWKKVLQEVSCRENEL